MELRVAFFANIHAAFNVHSYLSSNQGNRKKNGGLAGEPKKLFSGPEGVKYLSA